MKSDNEKAFELAVKYCNNDDGTCSIGCEVACNEMAEWKNEQIVGILKIAAPMLFGGQKNQIRDLLGWNINWDDYKEM